MEHFVASKAHRWPDGGTPLSSFHGGTRKAAERAVKLARVPVAPKPKPAVDYGPPPHLLQLLSKLPPLPSLKELRRVREAATIVRADRTRPRAKKHFNGDRPLLTQIATIQDFRCVICGTKMHMDGPSYHPQRVSFDHVTPRSLGGTNVGNRIATHRQCNSDKSNRPPTGCELVWLAAVNVRLGVSHG